MRGWPFWRHGAVGCWLRPGFQAACGRYGTWKTPSGRHPATNLGEEAGCAARLDPEEGSPRCAHYDLSQGLGPRTAGESMAHDQMAERTNEWLPSRFSRVRVHVASGHEDAGKTAQK